MRLHAVAWVATETPGTAFLLQRGTVVNARAEGEFGKGVTPLHEAAFGGHQAVVKLLLEHGADVNARNDAGKGPLDLAVEGGHIDVADMLRGYGASAANGG